MTDFEQLERKAIELFKNAKKIRVMTTNLKKPGIGDIKLTNDQKKQLKSKLKNRKDKMKNIIQDFESELGGV